MWSRNGLSYQGWLFPSTVQTDLLNGVLNPFVDTLANPLALDACGHVWSRRDGHDEERCRACRGPVFSLPAGDVTVTVGAEHRAGGSGGRALSRQLSFLSSVQSAVARSAWSLSESIASMEASVPLISPRQNIPGVRELMLRWRGATKITR